MLDHFEKGWNNGNKEFLTRAVGLFCLKLTQVFYFRPEIPFLGKFGPKN